VGIPTQKLIDADLHLNTSRMKAGRRGNARSSWSSMPLPGSARATIWSTSQMTSTGTMPRSTVRLRRPVREHTYRN